MKRYELKLKSGVKSSVYTIALVAEPAIEEDFIYLSSNSIRKISIAECVKFSQDEQGIIYTPVLIPNKNIKRVSETGEVYEVFFSEETVRQAARDFIAAGTLVSEFDNEHNEYERLEGVSVVESWTVDDPMTDKARKLGFSVPKGTWMQAIKVDNEEVRKKIKDGTYKGVSVEMKVDHQEVKFSKQSINNLKLNTMSKMAKAVSDIFSGIVTLSSEEVSEEVKFATLKDGEYILEDGRKIRVLEGRAEVMEAIEEMKEEEKEKMSEEAPKADLSQIASALKTLNDNQVALKKAIDANALKLNKLEETPASEVKLSTVETPELGNLKKFNLA